MAYTTEKDEMMKAFLCQANGIYIKVGRLFQNMNFSEMM